MLVLDVDKESSGSKQKFCPHSIFSMSAGVGRGSLKCEDDRSLLSQRLWSDILMCLRLNHTPTHTQPQTSDIPANPQTFRYLTSSYHTLRLRFDLVFTHIIPWRYHEAFLVYVFKIFVFWEHVIHLARLPCTIFKTFVSWVWSLAPWVNLHLTL